ncbi:insulinase family protein [Rosenbergiella nectarea]|uniref:insulinase family protein n=1 Tax=Rosenbergiella nectarea TaxID=988801 RepID=UPI001BDA8D42|nr:insulinase family protein [Rosenbergiella nectarea]MBT0730107.1 hypothetical protein [Rosenbergiella nectarea subsp. apis]
MAVIDEARRYRLSSGLEVNMEHIPHLQRAAVVWIFPVGSHQEPKEWPGLAHLTEHMVFSGGRHFLEQQRLMPWVQQQGGRLNATTQQNYTAYYFEVDPADLRQGLLRLNDMLTAPRFAAADLLRETAVIDEEYRLYSRSPHALASAALHSQVEYPSAFAEFHIGNAETFGSDMNALGAALENFYIEGYALELSQVWIASPLSCRQQYDEVADCFVLPDTPSAIDSQPISRVVESAPIGWQNWQGEIRLAKQAGLGITQVIEMSRLSDWPTFVELMTDTAPGSLCQVMSHQLGYYLSVRVERHYHDNQQIFFTLWFEGADFSEEDAQQSLALWQQWRIAASQLSTPQFDHYRELAQAEALRLPAMDFLREHALGFIFSTSIERELTPKPLQQALSSINHFALLRSRQESAIQAVECQGLYCQFQVSPLVMRGISHDHDAFIFYPQPRVTFRDVLPIASSGCHVPLHYGYEPKGGVSLILRPAAGAAISDEVRAILTQSLSPVLSLVKHAAGKVIWQQVNGNDLLFIRFGQFADLKECIANIIEYWPSELPASSIDGYGSLPLRELLQNVPSLLAEKLDRWMVSFIGPTQHDAEILQGMLSNLPLCWQRFQVDKLPLQQNIVYQASESDLATLVAFIPYPLTTYRSLMVYQQLAGYYESAFYHQLREIEAVGYAVACRQRVYRDRWGLQIILQSSHLSTQQLYERVGDFFQRLTLPEKGLTVHAEVDSESSGDEELDRYLRAHLPLETGKQNDNDEDFTLERGHTALIERVKDKQGGWIFIG